MKLFGSGRPLDVREIPRPKTLCLGFFSLPEKGVGITTEIAMIPIAAISNR